MRFRDAARVVYAASLSPDVWTTVFVPYLDAPCCPAGANFEDVAAAIVWIAGRTDMTPGDLAATMVRRVVAYDGPCPLMMTARETAASVSISTNHVTEPEFRVWDRPMMIPRTFYSLSVDDAGRIADALVYMAGAAHQSDDAALAIYAAAASTSRWWLLHRCVADARADTMLGALASYRGTDPVVLRARAMVYSAARPAVGVGARVVWYADKPGPSLWSRIRAWRRRSSPPTATARVKFWTRIRIMLTRAPGFNGDAVRYLPNRYPRLPQTRVVVNNLTPVRTKPL